ncbi:MAG: ABC transporter substrate-binding protein, partial [bacterium]
MSTSRRQNSYILMLGCLALALPRAASGQVEDMLAQLNRRPAEERQKTLLENAKKEGAVTFYTSTNNRDTQDIVGGFAKLYPGVKVNFLSLGGPGVLNKMITEYRAGVYNADVVELSGNNALELIDRTIVVKYKSPMVPFLRKGFVDDEGYWPGGYAIGYAFVFNSKRVAAQDFPRQYEDLLKPRWKGGLLMDAESYDLLAGLTDLWGEKKAEAFLRELVQKQGVTFARQSHTFMTQLVAAGEHDLIVDGYAHNAVKMKADGAPINYVFPNPTIVRTPSIVAIASHAVHPHAAALFEDYR